MIVLDPALPEEVRQALALVRAHVTADAEGWEALRDVDDVGLLANSLVRLVGVCLQLMVPAEAHDAERLDPAAVEVAGALAGMLTYQPGDDALDPERVDRLLADISGALARNHAGGAA